MAAPTQETGKDSRRGGRDCHRSREGAELDVSGFRNGGARQSARAGAGEKKKKGTELGRLKEGASFENAKAQGYNQKPISGPERAGRGKVVRPQSKGKRCDLPQSIRVSGKKNR